MYDPTTQAQVFLTLVTHHRRPLHGVMGLKCQFLHLLFTSICQHPNRTLSVLYFASFLTCLVHIVWAILHYQRFASTHWRDHLRFTSASQYHHIAQKAYCPIWRAQPVSIQSTYSGTQSIICRFHQPRVPSAAHLCTYNGPRSANVVFLGVWRKHLGHHRFGL